MTTIIIDRVNKRVISDSRGTETKVSGFIRTKVEEVVHDNIQKIFTVNKHVLTGCGTLGLILTFKTRIQKNKLYTPKCILATGAYEPDTTNVYINKIKGSVKDRFLKYGFNVGTMYTLKVTLTPVCSLFGVHLIRCRKKVVADFVTFDGSGSRYAEGIWNHKSGTDKDLVGIMETCIKCDKGSGGEIQIKDLVL